MRARSRRAATAAAWAALLPLLASPASAESGRPEHGVHTLPSDATSVQVPPGAADRLRRASGEASGPPERRVYAVLGDTARVPVPDGPADWLWRVEDEDGRAVRDWAPADPDGAVRVPRGGWFRLLERRGPADGAPRAVGGRFAAGVVVVITGQSQANSFFWSGDPSVGAFPAGVADPPSPPVAAWLLGCGPDTRGCGADGTVWSAPGDALGGRVLLAELARRLGPVPIALANGAWGGASASELADGDAPAGRRLRQVSRAAGAASAALVLAHGTTDTFRGTPPEAYAASLTRIVETLRGGGGEPGEPPLPVLLAPLPPLTGPTRLLGSGKLAAWLLPTEGAPAWMLRAGIAATGPLPAPFSGHADGVRIAQVRAAERLELLPGGDMAAVMPGLDGVHWSPDAVRAAARQAAVALARALRPP